MITRKLADISGPFFDPTRPFRNWSAFPFSQIDQAKAPYVDQAQLTWGVARARTHLRDLHRQGYTGIVIDNLAHLTTFSSAAEPIYRAASPSLLRAKAYRAAFRPLFEDAAELGMEVFVTTDMQWSTPELRAALGGITPNNPKLRYLNRLAFSELLRDFPQVSGLMMRIGEAGGAHDEPTGYTGHMIYTSTEELRDLIADLLPIAEQAKRLLIVRTWSVGIGPLGDLVCSPQRYSEVFGNLRSPHLLTSIKHVPADFFRLLPDNPTLGLPGPRQIIEFQNRREYELFGLAPSSTAALHGAALRRAAADSQCAGIWAWNSTGGWGGGQASLGTNGWSLWTELTSALTAAQAAQPHLDTDAFVRSWLNMRLSDCPPAFIDAVAALYQDSAQLFERGWYSGRLPNALPRLGGIVLTPLLWVWWMRPTTAPLIWAYLADAAGSLGTLLDTSLAARDRAAQHAMQLAALAPAGNGDAAFLVTSAHYLADALALAYALRAVLLPLTFAGDGDVDPEAVARLRTAVAQHQATWGARSDFPALELSEVRQLLDRLERNAGRVKFRLTAAGRLVELLRHNRHIGIAGVVGVAALTLGLLARSPARLSFAGLLAGIMLTPPIRRRALRSALPWIGRELELLPSIFFEAGPSLGEWAR
ncbi:MAG: hypothetical protein HC822_13420 [Oscillochloris sp.]|nr:hypothetical protein [Oscillochloris sp.]